MAHMDQMRNMDFEIEVIVGVGPVNFL